MSEHAQLARFAAVATLNLCVNLAVLGLCADGLALPERLGPPGMWLSQGAAVLAATSLGYVLHARFTFTNARRSEGKGRVGRYGAVAGGALALQVPLFAALMAGLERLSPGAPALPYIANVLGGAIIFFASFALNRFWTFQADRRGPS